MITKNRTRFDLVAPGIATLDLVDADDSPYAWRYKTSFNNLDLGEPGSVEEMIATLWQDGDKVKKVRDENREVVLEVKVEGPNLGACAQGGELLALALNNVTELHHQAADGPAFSPVSVFDVEVGTLKFQYNDVRELVCKRIYRVRLVCLPFVRPVDSISVVLESGSGDIDTLDNCATDTKWSTYGGGSDIQMLGAVSHLGESAIHYRLPGTNFIGAVGNVQWNDDVPAGTNYIAIDVVADPPPLGVSVDGAMVVSSEVVGNYTRYYLQVLGSGGIPQPLRAQFQWFGSVYHDLDFYIGNLIATDIVAVGGLFLGPVEGSQRTPAKITVTGDEGLVEAAVYTDSSMQTHGWVPDVSTTWQSAPEGSYLVHLVNPPVTTPGTIYRLDYGATEEAVTEVRAGYPVLFAAHLGGNESGRIGFIDFAVYQGASEIEMVGPTLRLFRQDEDAQLNWIPDLVADEQLVIDLPRRGNDRGGVYAGGRMVLDGAIAWAYPHVRPPFYGIWAAATGATIVEIAMEYFALYHSTVPPRL